MCIRDSGRRDRDARHGRDARARREEKTDDARVGDRFVCIGRGRDARARSRRRFVVEGYARGERKGEARVHEQ